MKKRIFALKNFSLDALEAFAGFTLRQNITGVMKKVELPDELFPLRDRVECLLRKDSFSLINEDGKTVCRLNLTEIEVCSAGGVFNFSFAELIPLKGYFGEFCTVQAAVEDQGGKETKKLPVIYSVRKAGFRPDAGKGTVEADKTPDAPAADVIRDLLIRLINIADEKEQGVIEDTDPEFLHDFRVALRRSRSAFSMFKGAFPPEEHEYFRQKLSRLFARTSLARDLDVYIKIMGQYRAVLPDSMQDDLEPVEKYLTAMKKKEHEKIVGLINSEEYSLFKNEWRDFLGRAVYGEKGMQRVRDAASEVIKNAYAKIVKDGRKLDNSSPASDIHKVRIGCKKLRYALEFFRPIFPSKQADAVTKKLKTLQDSLGAHQDYEVQREKLLRYTEEAAKGMKDKVNLSLASGYLARYLDELKCSERERCLEMIDSFISDKVRAQIKEMIK